MWPNPQESADLITFTEETLNGKLSFSYSATWQLGILSLLYLNYKLHCRHGYLPGGVIVYNHVIDICIGILFSNFETSISGISRNNFHGLTNLAFKESFITFKLTNFTCRRMSLLLGPQYIQH